MSIASQIERLQTVRDNAYDMCSKLGATIPSAQTFDNLTLTIRSIVTDNKEASMDGYCYDPKSVYYQLCNENDYTKDKSFLLCMYKRNTTSIALTGSDAYLTSDNIYYSGATTHTWDTASIKSNRWVAYIYNDETTKNYTFSDSTNVPDSIWVSGDFGTIYMNYNVSDGESRSLGQIVVPDGNSVDWFKSNKGEFLRAPYSFKNIKKLGRIFTSAYYQGTTFYFDGTDITEALTYTNNATNLLFSSIIMPNIETLNYFWTNTRANIKYWYTPKLKVLNAIIDHANSSKTGLQYLELPELTTCNQPISSCYHEGTLTTVKLPKLEYTRTQLFSINGTSGQSMGATMLYLYLGYDTNDRTKSVILSTCSAAGIFANLTDIELKQGYCKPLNVAAALALTHDNIVNHILDRLATNTGDVITIMLGSTNLAKLSNEEIAAATAKGYYLA